MVSKTKSVPQSSGLVRLKETVMIRPNCEFVCTAVQDLITSGHDILIEPEEIKIHGIMAAGVITKAREEVPVMRG